MSDYNYLDYCRQDVKSLFYLNACIKVAQRCFDYVNLDKNNHYDIYYLCIYLNSLLMKRIAEREKDRRPETALQAEKTAKNLERQIPERLFLEMASINYYERQRF